MRNPIETRHPTDVASPFSTKDLSRRQQKLLDMLPEYGSITNVKKRDVSMLDLSALTAKTGDEFALFTRRGERLIVRGNKWQVPLRKSDIVKLYNEGYKWSGHTHTGFTDADLISSQGDKIALKLFKQGNSAIYNAAGKYGLIYPKER